MFDFQYLSSQSLIIADQGKSGQSNLTKLICAAVLTK